MSIFIAGILVLLIPNSTEPIEPYGNNLNPLIEIVERSLHPKTGPGVRPKADARSKARKSYMSKWSTRT